MLKVLAERLRLLRGSRDQRVISDGSGVPLSSYSKWERGDAMPLAEAVVKLAAFHEVSSDYLLGITDHPAGLAPNTWLIDQNLVDVILSDGAGKFVAEEEWSFPVPIRASLLSSADYRSLRRRIRAAQRKRR
ncbi:MAG: helix-turn-helix domain-containing protein [bacterium]|nr:helix-turn-helix domain-containing protein [bacterium]